MATTVDEIFACEQSQKRRQAATYHKMLVDLYHGVDVDPQQAVTIASDAGRTKDDVERDLKTITERFSLVDCVADGDEAKPTLRDIESEIRDKSQELAELQRVLGNEIGQLQQVKYQLSDRVTNGDRARQQLLKTVLDQSIVLETAELNQRLESLWSTKDASLLNRYSDLLDQNQASLDEAIEQLREEDPDADRWLSDPDAKLPVTGINADRINQARRDVRFGMDAVEEKRRVVDDQRRKYSNAQEAMQAIDAKLAELRQQSLQP